MAASTKPLDGVSQWAMLTQGQASLSARTTLLINIERDKPTTGINPSSPSPPDPPPVFKGRSISLNHTVGTFWEDQIHPVRHPVPTCDMCGRDLCKGGGSAVIVTKEYMDSLAIGAAFNCSMAGVPDGPGPSQTGCNAVGQYAAMKGRHKILVGGGGTPNDWYHDGLPYNGTAPTPNNGCLVACQQAGCMHVPNIQVRPPLSN